MSFLPDMRTVDLFVLEVYKGMTHRMSSQIQSSHASHVPSIYDSDGEEEIAAPVVVPVSSF